MFVSLASFLALPSLPLLRPLGRHLTFSWHSRNEYMRDGRTDGRRTTQIRKEKEKKKDYWRVVRNGATAMATDGRTEPAESFA